MKTNNKYRYPNSTQFIIFMSLFLVILLILAGCAPQSIPEPPTAEPIEESSALQESQSRESALQPSVSETDDDQSTQVIEEEGTQEEIVVEVEAYPAPEESQTSRSAAAEGEDGYPAPSADSNDGANISSVVVVQTEAESSATNPNSDLADSDVIFVTATATGAERWSFSVTVAHPDTGWEDYADGWDVVLPDGTVAKANESDPFTRRLLHPHETEQPFTRSQSNIPIPTDITIVTVRAHDIVHGWGGAEITVDLTQSSGDGYEVK